MPSNRTKHGYAPLHGKRKPVYVTWQAMNNRCYTPSNIHYSNYGGRGIKVCARWRGEHGFENFLADMGEPRRGMSIERRDNDLGYSPRNCTWIPKREQAKNRRYNWKLTLNSRPVTAREAASWLKIHPSSLDKRLRKLNHAKTQSIDVETALRHYPSRFKGVSFDKTRNRWISHIAIGGGKSKFLGRFDTESEAHQAYLTAEPNYKNGLTRHHRTYKCPRFHARR